MRITEQSLRRLIRETLLTEAAITPQAALDMGITLQVNKHEEDMVEIVAYKDGEEVANLAATKNDNPCNGAWGIYWAETKIDGLGPLLYDLMFDVISPAPLMADRNEVSPDAKRVWDFYLKNRNDIEEFQLDSMDNFFTEKPDDNCGQGSADNWASIEGGEWFENSLSKAYARRDGRTPTLNTLWRLGNLDMDG